MFTWNSIIILVVNASSTLLMYQGITKADSHRYSFLLDKAYVGGSFWSKYNWYLSLHQDLFRLFHQDLQCLCWVCLILFCPVGLPTLCVFPIIYILILRNRLQSILQSFLSQNSHELTNELLLECCSVVWLTQGNPPNILGYTPLWLLWYREISMLLFTLCKLVSYVIKSRQCYMDGTH